MHPRCISWHGVPGDGDAWYVIVRQIPRCCTSSWTTEGRLTVFVVISFPGTLGVEGAGEGRQRAGGPPVENVSHRMQRSRRRAWRGIHLHHTWHHDTHLGVLGAHAQSFSNADYPWGISYTNAT